MHAPSLTSRASSLLILLGLSRDVSAGVLAPNADQQAAALEARAGTGKGSWTAPIQFPIVPVAAAMNPGTNGLVAWSAYAADTFQGNPGGPVTQTAVMDIPSGNVQQYPVYTGHDMFCPGISFDFNGNLVVTGGDTEFNTSTFYTSQWHWTPSAKMNLGRGYQSSTTLSDGRIFTIGGSWSDSQGGKDGEVYDGTSWKLMRGAAVAPMLTNDPAGVWRSDNHAWLFAWKNASAFQAGPSSAMNWYYPSGSGSYKSAGKRAADPDSMCGTAVMYDAVAGRILTAGGSPAYQDALATANVHLITLGTVGQVPSVSKLTSMSFARIFATSTVLPDGSVFIVGGQSYGVPFSDANTTLIPELWNSTTKTFTQMAAHAVPRNYHSFSILLPDARVITGGGGLCGNGCAANHFDAEIFSPPYLFGSDGVTPATRPVIASTSATSYRVGSTLAATLASSSTTGTITWSLVRYGSSTHTVNTDQRRAPLKATSTKTTTQGKTYNLALPADPGILLPGYWMLFAMQNGVPSVAKTVLITL